MTKPRPPLSFERALMRIADRLGWDGCAAILGKSESMVRKLSDPDIEREISMRDSRRLDVAFQRHGGTGAPMLECYARQVEIALTSNEADPAALIAAVAAMAKETGEAVSAALGAARDVRSSATRRAALIEIGEAKDALSEAEAMLVAMDQDTGG